jgi:hypothetical protein
MTSLFVLAYVIALFALVGAFFWYGIRSSND